jgi:aminoglycoside phosphotransferase (APT) family kinase protein
MALAIIPMQRERGATMESPHEPNAHRDIAAARLASLVATLAAIKAHGDDGHDNAQTFSNEHLNQTDSSLGTHGDHAPPMRRQMS